MKRFEAFDDSALLTRLRRLARTEVDLKVCIESRIREAELQRRWIPTDPEYQRLGSALRRVRKELQETEQEHVRRMSTSAAGVLAGA